MNCTLLASTRTVSRRISRAESRRIQPSREMSKLTLYSLTATPGELVATPSEPAVASSSRTTLPPVKLEPQTDLDEDQKALGRVSPRKHRVKVKYEEIEDDGRDLSGGRPGQSRSPQPTRPSSPPVKKQRRTPSTTTTTPLKLDPPPRWRETYDAIAEMRRHIVAPVDGMGCAAAGDREVDPVKARFAILISLMLSSQTKDEMTHRAVEKLRSDLPGGLTAQSLAEASESVVKTCISCVGFANRKTDYIKLAAVDCLEKHGGDIPRDLEGLLALKGVGPKMAYLVLENAWNDSQGLGVDIHVERITNRLGWHPVRTNKTAPNPELARRNLEAWLPVELWRPINPLLVGFGQKVCSALLPKCNECTLGPRGLCPSFDPKAGQRAAAKAAKLKKEGVEGSDAVVLAAKEETGPKVEIGLEEGVGVGGTTGLVWMKTEAD